MKNGEGLTAATAAEMTSSQGMDVGATRRRLSLPCMAHDSAGPKPLAAPPCVQSQCVR